MSQPASASVATENTYPATRVYSGRRAGKTMITSAPMIGVTMSAESTGKSVTSTPRVQEEEEEKRRGADHDPECVVAHEAALHLAHAGARAPHELTDPVDRAVDDPSVEGRAEPFRAATERAVDHPRNRRVVVVGVAEDARERTEPLDCG